MYFEVASKLVLASGTVAGTAYTQAVSMDGANSILAEWTNFASSAGSMVAEIGNDLENWNSTGALVAVAASNYGTYQATQIAARYVRLRFVVPSSTTIILGAGINTAQL